MTNSNPDMPVRRRCAASAASCAPGQERAAVGEGQCDGGNVPAAAPADGGNRPGGDRARWSGIEPYWRWVAPFKCANCGTRRRHALLRDDEYADWEEQAIIPGYP